MFELKGYVEPVRSLAFTGDGKAIWTGGEDSTLVLWDRFTGHSLRRLSLSQVLQSHPIEQLVPLESGNVLVRGHLKAFRIDLPENGKTRVQALPLGSHRRLIALSPAGQLMAILAPDDVLEVRSTSLGQVRSIHSVEGLYRPCWAAFSPDDAWLAVADSVGMVQLFSTQESGPPARSWEHERAIFMDGVFSPDSQHLTLAAGRSVMLNGVTEPRCQELASIASDAVFFHCVAYSPDGTKLAVGRWDGQIVLFDLSTHEYRAYQFHAGTVHSVAFSPDGLTAASGGDDYLAYVWDVQG